MLYLPMLQLFAYHRSMGKGVDPDYLRNLTGVVDLDRSALLAEITE